MLKWTGIEGAKTAEESPSTGVASCQSPLPFPRSSNLSAHEPLEGEGLGEGGRLQCFLKDAYCLLYVLLLHNQGRQEAH